MNTYNISLQFPNQWLQTQVTIPNEDFENGLITTFTDPDGTGEGPALKTLCSLLAEFYDFGAKYFEKGKLSGEEVAAQMSQKLGEIYLGNSSKSHFSYHFIGVWPHSVNFGELCYSSDPTVNLEVTWKFKRMELCHFLCRADQ